MNHYQDQAAAAIKRKDYNTALQQYNKALSRAESAKLYDARAACHAKLNDLPSALKDAKKCIQIAKIDPVGYLRAGKILTKMNKRVLLSKSWPMVSEHLMEEIKPVKSVDPMTVLPRELAINILEQLDFRQRMNVCSVSKAWNGFVKSVPELWEHLDFSRAQPHMRYRVKHAFVTRAINTARKKIRRATLNNMAKTEDAIELLVQHCPLESLTLLAVPRFQSNFAQILQPACHLKSLHFAMDEEQPFSMVRFIFETLGGQLEDFSCRMTATATLQRLTNELRLTKLKTLNIICQTIDSDVWKRLPALQSLKLHSPVSAMFAPLDVYDVQHLTQLQHLDISCGQLQFCCMKLPSTLRTLKVACKRLRGDDLAAYLGTPWPCLTLRALEELDLTMFFNTTLDVVLQSLTGDAKMISGLRRLTLRPMVLPDALQEFDDFCAHPALKDLEHIGLPHAIGSIVMDDYIDVIVKKFPSLTSLDMTSTDVTGVGVQSALRSPRLKELTLDDCPKLGLDAVQWARSKGVRIVNRKVEALGHERRIRQ
ncbi:hypothetical protein AMS68_005970 [Peltaster fructicola]|uniref:F-box domain-containing protein n=1 Tax=Peltaster fructicola TaxID=286661 RepID=A0A6H0Y0B3_9PEZI|nr:hypothetical protein AMS68_005970 [Peltaster fructicola]